MHFTELYEKSNPLGASQINLFCYQYYSFLLQHYPSSFDTYFLNLLKLELQPYFNIAKRFLSPVCVWILYFH